MHDLQYPSYKAACAVKGWMINSISIENKFDFQIKLLFALQNISLKNLQNGLSIQNSQLITVINLTFILKTSSKYFYQK